jgi:hypothetical protein
MDDLPWGSLRVAANLRFKGEYGNATRHVMLIEDSD